ncbi:hypothetical protein B0H13DRAFT_2343230 [Mycena leptocephala]|nr:hypothetical protein B0H13DRAFT_2343230 [Mycena leptocephala]
MSSCPNHHPLDIMRFQFPALVLAVVISAIGSSAQCVKNGEICNPMYGAVCCDGNYCHFDEETDVSGVCRQEAVAVAQCVGKGEQCGSPPFGDACCEGHYCHFDDEGDLFGECRDGAPKGILKLAVKQSVFGGLW